MRSVFLLAGAACALLTAACSKPASQTAADAGAAGASAASATADAASNTVSGATTAGGAISPPQAPENGAVNTDANKNNSVQTPGSNSFTEGQARGHIESAGYSDVSGLTKTADGMWVGKAKKDGRTVNVSVDFKGAVASN